MKPSRGITLVEIVVAVVALAVLAMLFLPPLARALRHKKVEACAANLRTLHRAQAEYAARHPAAPSGMGRAFWTRLSGENPPLVDDSVYACPVYGAPKRNKCQYLGPGGDAARLLETDPLGCDEIFNHSPNGREGGNVLLKSGAVRTDNEGFWRSCIHEGKCRP